MSGMQVVLTRELRPVRLAPPPAADHDRQAVGGPLVPTLIILGVLAVVFMIFTTFYTDFLWYASVDKSSVFTTLLADPVRAVRRLRPGDGHGGRRHDADRLPVAARARRDVRRADLPGALPCQPRAVPQGDPDRHPDHARRDGRDVGLGAVAVVHDLALRHAVRRDRPAVQPRRRLLRVPATRSCASCSASCSRC